MRREPVRSVRPGWSIEHAGPILTAANRRPATPCVVPRWRSRVWRIRAPVGVVPGSPVSDNRAVGFLGRRHGCSRMAAVGAGWATISAQLESLEAACLGRQLLAGNACSQSFQVAVTRATTLSGRGQLTGAPAYSHSGPLAAVGESLLWGSRHTRPSVPRCPCQRGRRPDSPLATYVDDVRRANLPCPGPFALQYSTESDEWAAIAALHSRRRRRIVRER